MDNVCTASRPWFLTLHVHPHQGIDWRWGGHNQADVVPNQTKQKDIPWHIMSCSVTKWTGGCLGRWDVFFFFLLVADINPLMGGGKWLLLFGSVCFLPFFFHFSFVYWKFFILLLLFLSSSSAPLWVGGGCNWAVVNPQHNISALRRQLHFQSSCVSFWSLGWNSNC